MNWSQDNHVSIEDRLALRQHPFAQKKPKHDQWMLGLWVFSVINLVLVVPVSPLVAAILRLAAGCLLIHVNFIHVAFYASADWNKEPNALTLALAVFLMTAYISSAHVALAHHWGLLEETWVSIGLVIMNVAGISASVAGFVYWSQFRQFYVALTERVSHKSSDY